MTVNACGGWILAIVSAGMLALGPLGLIVPYASLEVRLQAIGAAVLGLWVAPWLLRGYGVFARSMLAPTGQAELALRVRQLSETRTEALDTGAAEIRRIERDLHDGAQARLVAMGMTLDAAGQIIDTNPEPRPGRCWSRPVMLRSRPWPNCATWCAASTRRCWPTAAWPPRSEALALDSPMRIHLASDLEGRLPAPVESAAYFAVSELLANVSKHAEARQTWIDIRHTDGILRIGVTDNGHGGADPARGSGLRGIERRLAPFDGVLAVGSPPGGPTAVTMEIPCASSLPKTSSC